MNKARILHNQNYSWKSLQLLIKYSVNRFAYKTINVYLSVHRDVHLEKNELYTIQSLEHY